MFRVGRSDVDVHTYKRMYSPIYHDVLEVFFLYFKSSGWKYFIRIQDRDECDKGTELYLRG